ncbi:MAG: HPr family phosphocarrier protein [Ruthenibacterium sp.]
MQSFTYTIQQALGLHARPAGVMVNKLSDTPCSVTVKCGDRSADGKRLLALMRMAVKCGDVVTVEIAGDGEDAVAAQLKVFFAENF